MRRPFAIAGVVAAIMGSSLTLGGAASAGTAESSPEIAWVKSNVVVTGANPDQATIMAKYNCSGVAEHLWTSIKQGPAIDEEHNTSEFADAWYETPEDALPTCDGKTHVLRYTVTRVDGFDTLHKGEGWLQFVFFYINDEGQFTRAADVGWATVKAPGGHR
jgi:hypothetical protein